VRPITALLTIMVTLLIVFGLVMILPPPGLEHEVLSDQGCGLMPCIPRCNQRSHIECQRGQGDNWDPRHSLIHEP
jgi:hypothetical protein